MSILCAGFFPALQRTLLLDRFQANEVNRVRHVEHAVGGKAVNTASVLKTLGSPVTLMGFSGGTTGAAMEALVAQRHLTSVWVQTQQPVRICQTIRVKGESHFTELIEEGPTLPDEDWARFLATFEHAARNAKLVILSGTVPASAPTAFYGEMIRCCRAAQTIILDTSGPALLEALNPRRQIIVKINAEEILKSADTPPAGTEHEQAQVAAHQLLERGAIAVGITRGADPAWLFTPGHCQVFPIPSVPVKSALGSGDAVNAGLAAKLLAGAPLSEAFRYGIACGSANAATASPGILEADLVESLIAP